MLHTQLAKDDGYIFVFWILADLNVLWFDGFARAAPGGVEFDHHELVGVGLEPGVVLVGVDNVVDPMFVLGWEFGD